jgi:tRNA(fMet)-specific endonuclease VapC
MAYLLDTNAVIALLNETTSKTALRARRENPGDVAISVIVMHELYYGAFRSRRAAQNSALIDALQFVVLDFDKEDARQAGEV